MTQVNRVKSSSEDCAVLSLYQGALLDTGGTSVPKNLELQKTREGQVVHGQLRLTVQSSSHLIYSVSKQRHELLFIDDSHTQFFSFLCFGTG